MPVKPDKVPVGQHRLDVGKTWDRFGTAWYWVARIVAMSGSGIALDEHFDFRVDSTGDVLLLHGVDELKKDLALRAVRAVDRAAIGSVPNANTERLIRTQIQSSIESDPRVDSVTSVSVDTAVRNDRVSASITAIVDGEQLSFSI